jgi:hypothetical protein
MGFSARNVIFRRKMTPKLSWGPDRKRSASSDASVHIFMPCVNMFVDFFPVGVFFCLKSGILGRTCDIPLDILLCRI